MSRMNAGELAIGVLAFVIIIAGLHGSIARRHPDSAAAASLRTPIAARVQAPIKSNRILPDAFVERADRSDPVGYSRPRLATPLTVIGNAIVDAGGHTIVLGGIDRNGYKQPNGADITSHEADALARWATMVRLEVSTSMIECDSSPAAWLARLDDAVGALTRRNVVALIDLHVSSSTKCGWATTMPMPSKAGATAFWNAIGARFKDNPLVAFELWNEPHGVSADQWLNGGLVRDALIGTYEAEGMQGMYDTVVAVSSRNLIFVDGYNWASDAAPILDGGLGIDPSRTVWAAHVYTCAKPEDHRCVGDKSNRAFPSSGVSSRGWDSLALTAPVVVTETGFPDPSDGTWLRTATTWAGKHSPAIGIVGFASDGPWGGSPFAILSPRADFAPNPAGAALVEYMKDVG